MSWNNVIDQRRVVEALRGAIAAGRVAHAYLFRGPDGVGKRAVAIEFAKALLCERGGDEGCGACRACSRVERMLHPDLRFFFAQPKDTDASAVAERLQLLARNPYAAVDFLRRPSLGDPTKSSNKQAIYDVDRVREEIIRTTSLTPVEGRYKVTVITDAELFNAASANAFLKTLEEPAPRSVFILTTSRPDLLLPTILSRCQSLRFEPLPPEALAAALVEREGVDPDAAETLARMADGSYMEALDLARNDDLMGLRMMVLDFMRMSYARNIERLADLVDQTARLGRDQVKNVLELMLRWVRDLILHRSLGGDAPLVNVDQKDAVAKFSENLPDADLEGMVGVIEEAIHLIERNAHVNLTLTVLSQRIGRAMRGRLAEPLYVPLADEELRRTA